MQEIGPATLHNKQTPWNEMGDLNLLLPLSWFWSRFKLRVYMVLVDTRLVELNTRLSYMAPNPHKKKSRTDYLGTSYTQYQHPTGQWKQSSLTQLMKVAKAKEGR